MKTCGIPSTVDTRSFTNSAVGKTPLVDVIVGIGNSIVEVGIIRGGMVGSGVDVVDATTGGVPVQAARMNKRTGMIFFDLYIGKGDPSGIINRPFKQYVFN